MLESERETGAERESLAENRQTLLAASLEPRHAALMNFGIAARGRDHVVQDWPICLGGQPFEEREVILDVTGRLSDLDKALVAIAQHAREVQDVLVAHRVCDHRRSVKVGLRGIRPESLHRKSAEA